MPRTLSILLILYFQGPMHLPSGKHMGFALFLNEIRCFLSAFRLISQSADGHNSKLLPIRKSIANTANVSFHCGVITIGIIPPDFLQKLFFGKNLKSFCFIIYTPYHMVLQQHLQPSANPHIPCTEALLI